MKPKKKCPCRICRACKNRKKITVWQVQKVSPLEDERPEVVAAFYTEEEAVHLLYILRAEATTKHYLVIPVVVSGV